MKSRHDARTTGAKSAIIHGASRVPLVRAYEETSSTETVVGNDGKKL